MIIGKDNYNYIQNYPGKNANFKFIEKFEYIFAIDSTLGIENLVKNGKTGFLSNRPFVYPLSSRSYGYMEGLKRKGFFWTTYPKQKEFIRVFNSVINGGDKTWINLRKKHRKITMEYDKNNKKFLKIINKLLAK